MPSSEPLYLEVELQLRVVRAHLHRELLVGFFAPEGGHHSPGRGRPEYAFGIQFSTLLSGWFSLAGAGNRVPVPLPLQSTVPPPVLSWNSPWELIFILLCRSLFPWIENYCTITFSFPNSFYVNTNTTHNQRTSDTDPFGSAVFFLSYPTLPSPSDWVRQKKIKILGFLHRENGCNRLLLLLTTGKTLGRTLFNAILVH